MDSRSPALWQRLLSVPLLMSRLLRWKQWRGSWLLPHLLGHRPFDRRQFSADSPVDIMVVVADHYEPSRSRGPEAAIASVRSWCEQYEALASEFRDSDGRHPQHTWFHRYDYPEPGCVQALSQCAFRGFGEIEFHLHHGHDTAASFERTIREGTEWYSRFGAMLTASETPERRFAYIAGNSALDNGAGDPALSGCDTEIGILSSLGCYADFTFPNMGSKAQPSITNTFYYASEDGKPRSYEHGVPMRVGGSQAGDLLMFQGPTAIDWGRGRIDEAAVEDVFPAAPYRLANWLRANVHVPGRPEWVFVKLWTHAMQNRRSFLSDAFRTTWQAMQEDWNRPPFRLHFVTAREAYNIAKAAEAGMTGNAGDYRDYLIAPPANRVLCCNRPWKLLTHTADRIRLRVEESGPTEIQFGDQVHVRFAQRALQSLRGNVREVDIQFRDGEPLAIAVEAQGEVRAEPRMYQPLLREAPRRENANV
jgi:hypothetical protein